MLCGSESPGVSVLVFSFLSVFLLSPLCTLSFSPLAKLLQQFWRSGPASSPPEKEEYAMLGYLCVCAGIHGFVCLALREDRLCQGRRLNTLVPLHIWAVVITEVFSVSSKEKKTEGKQGFFLFFFLCWDTLPPSKSQPCGPEAWHKAVCVEDSKTNCVS